MTKRYKNDDEWLKDSLERNRGTYTISKDGVINLDMANLKVIESFEKQAEQCRELCKFMKNRRIKNG